MKQGIFLSLSFFIFLNHIYSQNSFSISGRITDLKTGQPLYGASISIADDKLGTATDSSGNYVLKNISSGHHIIEVSYTGYATITEHIELFSNLQKSYALNTLIVENQGVVVTGVAGSSTIRRMPIAVSSVRKNILLQSAATNIIDVLARVPGVAQLSSGPAVSKPFIRGLGYNRVLVLNDGVRQEGQQWGDEHGVEIDEMSVARVEVLKGPASLMYGSDAIAGVINFISNVPVPDNTIKGNVITNYQSNNHLYAIDGNVAGNKNGLSWNVYGTYKSAGNYQNIFDGRVLNSGFNERNAGGYFGINKKWGFSHFIISRFDQRLGLVEGERDAATGKFVLFGGTPIERVATDEDLNTRNLFVPMQRVQHNKIVSDNNFIINKSRLKLNFAYQDNLRQEFGNPISPEVKSLFFDLRTLNYNAQWQFPEFNEWHTTIGIGGMQQQNFNRGEETLIPEYHLFDIGGFVYTMKQLKHTTLSGGLRFDNRAVHADEQYEGAILKFASFTRSFSNSTGSIGISSDISKKVTLKANIAKGFRAPSLAELASNGAHEGTNRYEYGDNGLTSEKSLEADAGMELNTEHISLSTSLFYNHINDFIFYRKLKSSLGTDSLVNNSGNMIPAFKFNQQNAALAGAEISIDIHPHPLDWLHAENIFSLVKGWFVQSVDGSNHLPLIPAPNWKSNVKAEFKSVGKTFQRLYTKIEMDKTFQQNRPFTGYDTETATPGYTLWNMSIGSDIVNIKKKTLFSVYLVLQNMFDKAYQSHLSRFKYLDVNQITGRQGVFNAGRNFSMKINVPLNFKGK